MLTAVQKSRELGVVLLMGSESKASTVSGTAHRLRDDFDTNQALRIVTWVDHLLLLLGDALPALDS